MCRARFRATKFAAGSAGANWFFLPPLAIIAALADAHSRSITPADEALVGNKQVTRPAPDRCFAPVARRDATVLILGSLPGQKSLELQQYYAHPQNGFWKIMDRLFDASSSLPYTQRLKILTANHVALWDVCAAAERPGSLDSSIVPHSAVANDFAAFFSAHPHIRRVFFNGQKAEELFRRRVLPGLGAQFGALQYTRLPSTSPAHAGMTFARKLDQWRKIKETRT